MFGAPELCDRFIIVVVAAPASGVGGSGANTSSSTSVMIRLSEFESIPEIKNTQGATECMYCSVFTL